MLLWELVKPSPLPEAPGSGSRTESQAMGVGGVRGLNGNGKNTIKIKLKIINKFKKRKSVRVRKKSKGTMGPTKNRLELHRPRLSRPKSWLPPWRPACRRKALAPEPAPGTCFGLPA